VSVADSRQRDALGTASRDTTADVVTRVLSQLPGLRVAVVGDFCLDAYWELDSSWTETSVETGLEVRRVRAQRYQLGGAGNVVANLCAMGVGAVRAIGSVGDDSFGQVVHGLLSDLGVDTAALRRRTDMGTPVYIKPLREGVEENRIDLSASREATGLDRSALVADLAEAANWAHVILVNQQLPDSADDDVIAAVNRIATTPGAPIVVVDSRQAAHRFEHATLKCNHDEMLRVCTALGFAATSDEERVLALTQHTGRPVFLTRGVHGIMMGSDQTLCDIPGIEVTGQHDPVGAGDTVLAAIGAALAAGASPSQSAIFANLAAAVAVTKLHTTGTVSPAEATFAASRVSYAYLPALATNPDRAQLSTSGRIEIVTALPSDLVIRHVVFDHDGTLSTLREGWETVMEGLMETAIRGDSTQPVSTELLLQVREASEQLIRTTTGAPTIVQMEGLTDLIRRFGLVPAAQVQTSERYKSKYSRLLAAMVDERVRSVRTGGADPSDYQIKGARQILELLSESGVRLYLASGTDTAAVRSDALALGYAELFDERISGATDDPSYDAKRVVMDAIVARLPAGETFAVFGDGPVELREARRRGGVAIGVCSDEQRRYGFNAHKRPRLIRAGADLLIGDYTDPHEVLHMLGLS
jgi:rfaE bifunctional protein kinase chain/domain